jgi:hypothetical protein
MKRKGPQRDIQKQRFWQRAVQQWRRSGHSIRDYCRENALSEPSFYAWRRELTRRKQPRRPASRRACQAPTRLAASSARPSSPKSAERQRGSGNARAAASFLPVRVVRGTPSEAAHLQAAGGVEIVLDQRRTLRVAAGFDRQTLADVLAVLEERPC